MEKLIISTNSEIRIDESGAGTWSGYANTKYNVDSHGTLMLDGCYLNSIPSFLLNNCAPDTHGVSDNCTPTYHNILGYYTQAVEDDYGLWVEGNFHSDPKSQAARQKMLERQAAGISNGMSIGFEIPAGTDIWIYQKDYDIELPKYIPSNKLAQVLEQVADLPCVRLLTEVIVTEVSPTVIPSNIQSVMEEVRFEKMEHNYTKNSEVKLTKKTELNGKNMEIRVAKKLSKDTYDKLSAHLDKLDGMHDDHMDKLSDHMDDLKKSMKDAKDMKKSMKEMRDTIDKLNDSEQREEDDAHEEPDGDEPKGKDKRSMDDIYNMLKEISNKNKEI